LDTLPTLFGVPKVQSVRPIPIYKPFVEVCEVPLSHKPRDITLINRGLPFIPTIGKTGILGLYPRIKELINGEFFKRETTFVSYTEVFILLLRQDHRFIWVNFFEGSANISLMTPYLCPKGK